MCVAALRQDFANTPPALASNMRSSRILLPGVTESIHTSHRLRVTWLIARTRVKHSQKAVLVLFPSHAKHRARVGCLQVQQSVSAVNNA
jgi:hypothetical protein